MKHDGIKMANADDASTGTSSSKRRRRTSPSPDGGKIRNITHLPSDQLIAIADFLPKTSRALFAVSLTALPSSWRATGWRGEPSETSKAIISSTKPSKLYSVQWDSSWTSEQKQEWRDGRDRAQKKEYYEACWDILDFVDIEEGLAKKLTDDDIGGILVCIDAKASLKKLRLTRCQNM